MQKQNIIEVNNLSKIYKDGSSRVTALDSVSFSLPAGQNLSIVGPSGSGKTTLLEILGGLSNPTAGSVVIDGQDPFRGSDKNMSEFRRQTIGFVFQNMHLQEYFTALENVMLPQIISGISWNTAKQKAEQLLVQVGLQDRMNHRPSKLSGGQQQRVAIARSLINDPKIIMADEPTAKLDQENEAIVLDIFHQISSVGVSVLIITHDPKVAQQFSNQIKIQHGKII